jgi:hypothetical protein
MGRLKIKTSKNKNLDNGESHDQADAEWMVIRTQLRGHNDTAFRRPAPAGPPAARGLRAYFVCFSYY